MLDKNNSDTIGFLGSVGDDSCGNKYIELLEKEGIISYLEKIPNKTTGTCLVVCGQGDRAHFTDLGASILITKEYTEKVLPYFKDAILIYTELFIIKTQKELLFKIAQMGENDSKIFGFNLPSFYFLDTFENEIMEMISYSDIFFSNISEAKYFANKSGIDTTISTNELIVKLAKLNKKNKNKNRIVVITAGELPAWVCEYNFRENKVNHLKSYEANKIPKNLIVDTNGAGDAFAGGFLSQYIKGKDLDRCMKAGHWAASKIIQKTGCLIEDFKYEYTE